ncbi:DDE superfamily endonuclease [Streptomyces sp. KS 21]|nr:DDE superfamily endonuclease [Streptomyces sp. KS 21]
MWERPSSDHVLRPRTHLNLTLLAEHRRGHGALYDALNHGRIDIDGLRRTLAALPRPKAADDRLLLTVDVTNRRPLGSKNQRPATRYDVGRPSGAPRASSNATGSDHKERA